MGARVTNNLTRQSREAFSILEGVFSDLAAVECVVEVLKVGDEIYSHLGCILLLGQDTFDLFIEVFVGPMIVFLLLIKLSGLTEFESGVIDRHRIKVCEEHREQHSV